MSSIRPLATITVLALVGAFLYAKINETEPQLPEGVDDWNVGELNFDMSDDMGGADSMTVPQFSESTPVGEAPPVTSNAATADSAPAFSPAESSAAPAWNSLPAAAPAPSAEIAVAPAFNSTTAAPAADLATSDLPDLPPLPTMPPAASTVAPVDNVTLSIPAEVADATETNIQIDAPAADVQTAMDPAISSEANTAAQAQSSLFSATRLAVQSALDRGELSQALLLLSDWYGDPSLSASEAAEVDALLGQLAGSVIYSTEPRLEPPYMVQAGERLEEIAKQYDVPWQLLAKINGITSADQIQPGQKIKVLRGPFSAVVDMSKKTMTLMLDRRYAGKFALEIDPSVTVEAGHWEVQQKLLTPGNASLPGAAGPTTPTDERSLMLSNANGGTQKVAVLRGTISTNPLTEPAGRIMRMKPSDAADVFDILSLGSKVVIRR